ncbi:hypothetical protein AAHA92_13610 [Salvia divinorum]|uniref:Uncharacterized protein n=1 Tax=Salvia divinorum TaxID=28513 RepID=A0ABD1HCN4_SALDI
MRKKYTSARKPPLPPRPIRADTVADTVRSGQCMLDPMASTFIYMVKTTYKVKGEWSHNYNKNLAQLVLIKLQSSLSKKPKPLPKNPAPCSLDNIAKLFASIVQYLFKVVGQWSYDYNDDLIQLAIIKLRSNKPVAVGVGAASPSKKLKGS